jgi:hypothetical protein
VRRREGLEFWSAVGAWLVGCPALDTEASLPDPMPPLPPPAPALLGARDPGVRARHLQSKAWSALREAGFSKALRLEPWPGIELFLPYWRGRKAVTIQGFTRRIPGRERALALAGKSSACRMCGWELTVVLSSWDEGVIDILESGGAGAVSLDRLAEWLSGPGPGTPPGRP